MPRPNVVLVLADDLGFSDIGCFGGEIRTPNLDRLANGGVRLSNFYNTARCSPSRASLLTGLHPHQTGIGILTSDDSPRSYPGTLNDRCVTLAEVLGGAGYATCLSGKWHLVGDTHQPNDAWPTRRGFARFFGTLVGCGSYFQPGTLVRGETNIENEPIGQDFYYTDAISDEAVAFIHEQRTAEPDRPFFLFVAYTAPHWPLHARNEDIVRYQGAYDVGWDALRDRRMQRLRAAAVLDESAALSERDPTQPPWAEADDKAWQARRMEVYAAQVDRMDQGVGRVARALDERDCLDNTLILFLSDNGASAEHLPLWDDPERFASRADILRSHTRAGQPVRIGNDPEVLPGSEDTYASYGRAWANLSNTPFRFYKRWVHEGGIASPLIASWPSGGLVAGRVVATPFQLTDVLPTILEATAVDYPAHYAGRALLPPEGRSMLPALGGQAMSDGTLYWEHVGNAAIRRDRWKLVREYPHPWELYDLSQDRSETRNLADQRPQVVHELAAAWQEWAARVGVIPFDTTIEVYRERGLGAEHAAG